MDNHEKVFKMPSEEFDKVFNPAPQVLPMATREASGQNVEADRATIGPVTAGAALCDERLAGGSNSAVAGPSDTPRTNEFFSSCTKVTGWNHVYSQQASFCRTLEREIAALHEMMRLCLLARNQFEDNAEGALTEVEHRINSLLPQSGEPK